MIKTAGKLAPEAKPRVVNLLFQAFFVYSRVAYTTLKKILHLHPPKYEILNQLVIKSLNQPYYLVDSTK